MRFIAAAAAATTATALGTALTFAVGPLAAAWGFTV